MVKILRSVIDGFFLFLKPLPPGEHKLEFKVSVMNPTKTEYRLFSRYNLSSNHFILSHTEL